MVAIIVCTIILISPLPHRPSIRPSLVSDACFQTVLSLHRCLEPLLELSFFAPIASRLHRISPSVSVTVPSTRFHSLVCFRTLLSTMFDNQPLQSGERRHGRNKALSAAPNLPLTVTPRVDLAAESAARDTHPASTTLLCTCELAPVTLPGHRGPPQRTRNRGRVSYRMAVWGRRGWFGHDGTCHVQAVVRRCPLMPDAGLIASCRIGPSG